MCATLGRTRTAFSLVDIPTQAEKLIEEETSFAEALEANKDGMIVVHAKGGKLDNPNRGCQCSDFGANGEGWDNCLRPETTNYLPLPPGYELAPNDEQTLAVVAAHGWSTTCLVLADGSAWKTANRGKLAGEKCVLSHRNSLAVRSAACVGDVVGYSVTQCNLRVLARCT